MARHLSIRRPRLIPRDELLWRARGLARIQLQRATTLVRPSAWDRRRFAAILAPGVADATTERAMDAGDWPTVHQALLARLQRRRSRFVLDPACSEELVRSVRGRWPEAASHAAARAERILAGRYDLLGYSDVSFAAAGGSVDWHRDPVHDRRAPMAFWADVPYLDPAIGDHKIIWEINRHQHWVQLGRAFWLLGDSRYRNTIVEQLESWLAANPPLIGINWASMLEIGLRSVSWTWALHCLLAGRPNESEPPWLVDMLLALDRQLTHVEQNLSYFFSPNTHLTGEALALYVVGHALPELGAGNRWVALGRDILLREIDRQILADGGHAERSTHYHRYTLDIYLLALLTATRTQDTAAIPRFTDAVRRLAEFARTVADDRGLLPLIGDDDGGTLWQITGRACHDVRDSLALAAVVLRRPDLAPWDVPEEVLWIAGPSAVDVDELTEARDDAAHAASHTFADTGYVVARDANGGHAVFDVGAHGYLNGGHAHADALAMTLSVAHRPLLIDPGTFTYTMDRALRDRMRGTMNHNTLVVDGRPQSIPSGPFHWRTRADAQLHAWRHNPYFDWAEASHDGYAPLRHRRTLFRSCCSSWLVVDEILGSGPHSASACWHFDPAWEVTAESPGCLRATHVDGDTAWLLHDARTVGLARGDEQSGLGWCSPVYGMLVPTWSAQVMQEAVAPFAIVTWVGAGDDGRPPSLERLFAISDPPGSPIAARVIKGDRTSVFMLRPGEPTSHDPRSVGVLDCQTDARALHCVTSRGRLLALDLVDASYALAPFDGELSVTADALITELHVAIDAGVLDLRSSDPPARIRLEGSVIADLFTVRLNGHALRMKAAESANTLVIAGENWRSEGSVPRVARALVPR